MRPRIADPDDEPEVIEAKARQAIDEAIGLSKSRGWERLMVRVRQEIDWRRDQLEASDENGDRHRGAIEALRDIEGWPTRMVQSADAVLNRYRGDT